MERIDSTSELANEKVRAELQILAADLKLKNRDLQSKQRGISLSVPAATVIVGALTFFGSYYATYKQGSTALEQKRLEIDSNVILRAVETGNVEASKKNLQFLLEAGFIKDADGRIAKLIASPAYALQLPARMSEPLRNAVQANDLRAIVQEIVVVAGIPENFTIQLRSNVTSASAVREGTSRFILVNPTWILGVRTATGTDWASIFILAHEIGHHLLDHTLLARAPSSAVMRQWELDADRFAGAIVRRLSGSMEDARRSLATAEEQGSMNSPSRAERMEAAAKGWQEGAINPVKR